MSELEILYKVIFSLSFFLIKHVYGIHLQVFNYFCLIFVTV